MKPATTLSRVYDLAAMRGWRTIRLDRVPATLQRAQRLTPAQQFLPKAA